jgi:hypothetical protein
MTTTKRTTVDEPKVSLPNSGDDFDDAAELDDLALPEDKSAAESVRDAVLNLDDYRLDQDFDPNEIEEETPIAVSKPPKDDYFRVHPDPTMSTTVGIYETSDGETYLVKKNMRPLFGDLVSVRQVFVCVTARGKRFLWLAKLPRADGGGGRGGDKYNRTALKAAEKAKIRWTRMYSDQTLRLYRMKHPADPLPEPDWSKLPSLIDLMNAAFGDGYVIANVQHPEARRLR